MTGHGREPDVFDRWLREGQVTLDRITGGAPDVIGVMDRELIVRYLNWTTPGLTREAAVGQTVFNLVPPEYTDIARETFGNVLRTGVPTRFETHYRGEHGVLVWVVRVGPIVHEGQVIGLVTISTDVTELRREGIDRDRFFSLSLDMLIVATPDGKLRRINPAFGEALGYSISEIVGQRFMHFVHPDDVARTQQAFEDALSGHPVLDFENRYLRSDGAYRVFSWRATVDPLTGDVYAVARDITDHRATEAQLRHAQKMEAVGQLAGGIAHDFNNLMQAVLANVEIAMMRGKPSPDLVERLREIEGAGRRAADLTKQLLVFSRRQPLHRIPIDLSELIQSLMKLLQRLLPESIAIDLRLSSVGASVHADQTQLEQVIINLCVNARDAMEHGGQLVLQTDRAELSEQDCESQPWARAGRYVRLRVTDTGVGMTPDVRERIFDPFFTTKNTLRGTGLGLATVYAIVQQHGGLVHVQSEVGHGTTFDVYLVADDRPSAPRSPSTPIEIEPAKGHETILLAEDEPLVRRTLVEILESAGYRVIAAANGSEALTRLCDHPEAIDLAILDVVMPELGGPQAWERMQGIRSDLPVIFMSGYADDDYRARLPPDAEVMAKPFRTDELLRVVRRKIDR